MAQQASDSLSGNMTTADQLAANANAAWGPGDIQLGELNSRFNGDINYGNYNISSGQLTKNLNTLSSSIGKTINIKSGNRTPLRNLTVGGVNGSRHTFGDAADISVDGMSNLDLAIKSNDSGLFNTTIYYPEINLPGALAPHVHVDMRPGVSRFLIYSPKMVNGKIKHGYNNFK